MAIRPIQQFQNEQQMNAMLVIQPLIQFSIESMDRLFKLFNKKMNHQQNAYEWKIQELSKPVPKNIDELYEISLKEQIEQLNLKLEKQAEEKSNIQKQLNDLHAKLEMIYSESIFETLPQMSVFCQQMKKFLAKSETLNSQNLSQLFSFKNIMNFQDPNKNKYLLKERTKKSKEVQTEDERYMLSPEIYNYLEQEKLSLGRPELSCLFQYFDAQTLRGQQKERVMDKAKFTEQINCQFMSYVDIYHRKQIQFKNHCMNQIIDLSCESNSQHVIKSIIQLFNSSHEFSDLSSRYSHLGNYFAAKMFNQLVAKNKRKSEQPIIHDQLCCQFMKELQNIKQENKIVDYQICSEGDIKDFIQYNYIFNALRETFTLQRIKTFSNDYHKKFIGLFFEYLIIQEAFGYHQSEKYDFQEKYNFLDNDILLETIIQNKSKLMTIARDRVIYVIEKETDIFKREKSYLKRKQVKKSQKNLVNFMENFIGKELLENIEQVEHQNEIQEKLNNESKPELLNHDIQIIQQYYDLLVIKIMIFDEKHMPRTIRKMFKEYGSHKESLTREDLKAMLINSFEGYITDFEVEFLLIFLAVNQIEKGDLTEEEKDIVLEYLNSNILIEDKQTINPEGYEDLQKQRKLRPYFLKHLQRDLHYVEDQKVLQYEMSNKLRVFNAFNLALSSDSKYYAYERLNQNINKYDQSNISKNENENEYQMHKLQSFEHFNQFISDYIFDEGGFFTHLPYQLRQDMIYDLYLKICNKNSVIDPKLSLKNQFVKFNTEELIHQLKQLRVFTGFQVQNDEIRSPLFRGLKRRKSKKKIDKVSAKSLNDNKNSNNNITVISNETQSTAVVFQENELLKKITLNLQKKLNAAQLKL
eukprot:403334492